jgi:hypothetical protein
MAESWPCPNDARCEAKLDRGSGANCIRISDVIRGDPWGSRTRGERYDHCSRPEEAQEIFARLSL